MNRLSRRLRTLNPEKRELLEKRLKKEGIDISKHQTEFSSIPCVEKKEYYGVSSSQKRLYFFWKLNIESTGFNVSYILNLEKEIDEDELKATLKKMIKRRESLRTSFEIVNDKLVQRIHDDVDFDIECCKSSESKCEVEEMIKSSIKPFDLAKAPLLRIRLITTGESRQILLFDIHHILIDRTAQTILVREFMAIYSGEVLSPLRLYYKDYAAWQNSEEKQEFLKQQELYWVKLYSGKIPLLNLPTDYSRGSKQDHGGDEYEFELNEQLTSKLRETIFARDVTLFIILIAAYNILLSRLSRQEDIIVGIPIEGRNHNDLKNIIGLFLNIAAFRNFPGKRKTFVEFLDEVKENALKTFANQDFQFEMLLEKLKIEREPGRNPLFDTVFNMQKIKKLKFNPDTKFKGNLYEFKKRDSRYDINIYAYDMEDKIEFVCTYRTSLFKKSTIKYIMSEYLRLIEEILEDQNKFLKDYEIFD